MKRNDFSQTNYVNQFNFHRHGSGSVSFPPSSKAEHKEGSHFADDESTLSDMRQEARHEDKRRYPPTKKRYSERTFEGISQRSDYYNDMKSFRNKNGMYLSGVKPKSSILHDLSFIKQSENHFIQTPKGKICRSILSQQSSVNSFDTSPNIFYSDYVEGKLDRYIHKRQEVVHDVLTANGAALGKIDGVMQEKGNLIVGDFVVISDSGKEGELQIGKKPLKLQGQSNIPEQQEKSVEETRIIIGRQANQLYRFDPELEQQIADLHQQFIALIKSSLDELNIKAPVTLGRDWIKRSLGNVRFDTAAQAKLLEKLAAYMKDNKDGITAVNRFLEYNGLACIPDKLNGFQKTVGKEGNIHYSKTFLIEDLTNIFHLIETADMEFTELANDIADSEAGMLPRRGHSESYLYRCIPHFDLTDLAALVKKHVEAGATSIKVTLYILSTKEMCNACTFLSTATIAGIYERIKNECVPQGINISMWMSSTGREDRARHWFGTHGDPDSQIKISRTIKPRNEEDDSLDEDAGYLSCLERAEFISDTVANDYRKGRQDPALHNQRIIMEKLAEKDQRNLEKLTQKLSQTRLSHLPMKQAMQSLNAEDLYLSGLLLKEREDQVKEKILASLVECGSEAASYKPKLQKLRQNDLVESVQQKLQANVPENMQPDLSVQNKEMQGIAANKTLVEKETVIEDVWLNFKMDGPSRNRRL